jgi:hypothetical protein
MKQGQRRIISYDVWDVCLQCIVMVERDEVLNNLSFYILLWFILLKRKRFVYMIIVKLDKECHIFLKTLLYRSIFPH